MTNPVVSAVVNSATWAAFGDAVGFVTELADVRLVRKRAGVDRVETTIPWRRPVGGKFGVDLELAAGAYSDDTQLRLATSRAVRGDGRFDPEAFAKIELPVWSAYALGAGRGSRAAAAHLSRQDVTWFSNFFDERTAAYVRGGGNGAAIRVQPHVWSALAHALTQEALLDLIRNALTSHGHMRGVVGAFLHAACLSYALRERAMPAPRICLQFCEEISRIGQAIEADSHMRTIWLPSWEERSGKRLREALEQVRLECIEQLTTIVGAAERPMVEGYERIIISLRATDAETRGSGVTTALIAAALAWLARDEGPAKAITLAANTLGTDTDSIATMTGAMLGAVAEAGPTGALQDRTYIEREAIRLSRISRGEVVESFGYPDLLSWTPPRSQVDAVGRMDGKLALAGIGIVREEGRIFDVQPKGDTAWQWLELNFGQSVAAKRRKALRRLPPTQWPVDPELPKAPEPERFATTAVRRLVRHKPEQAQLFDERDAVRAVREPRQRADSLDELTDEAIRSGFDPAVIGRHILLLADREHGMERSVAYVATIAKARIARLRLRKAPER